MARARNPRVVAMELCERIRKTADVVRNMSRRGAYTAKAWDAPMPETTQVYWARVYDQAVLMMLDAEQIRDMAALEIRKIREGRS